MKKILAHSIILFSALCAVQSGKSVGYNMSYNFADGGVVLISLDADPIGGFLTNITNVMYTVDGVAGPTDTISNNSFTAPPVIPTVGAVGLDFAIVDRPFGNGFTIFTFLTSNVLTGFPPVLPRHQEQISPDGWTPPQTSTVPDLGKTSVLLGAAMLGLVALRRKIGRN